MEVPFSSLYDTEFSRLVNGKTIIYKNESKSTPPIFKKLNIFTENENMDNSKKDNQDINTPLLHLNIYIII